MAKVYFFLSAYFGLKEGSFFLIFWLMMKVSEAKRIVIIQQNRGEDTIYRDLRDSSLTMAVAQNEEMILKRH